MKKHMDTGSLTVALVTLALFVGALFTKGFTHDLFLEVGVFLVSVKIIMMSYKNSVAVGRLEEKVDELLGRGAAPDEPPGVPEARAIGAVRRGRERGRPATVPGRDVAPG